MQNHVFEMYNKLYFSLHRYYRRKVLFCTILYNHCPHLIIMFFPFLTSCKAVVLQIHVQFIKSHAYLSLYYTPSTWTN